MSTSLPNAIRAAFVWSGLLTGFTAIGLLGGKTPPKDANAPIVLTVDATRDLGPISPAIYGMAVPKQEHITTLRLPLWRWGGNPNTRYNWEHGSSWNAARDWEFRNYGQPPKEPSSTADKAIAIAKAAGAETLLTIPTIGWVARKADKETRSLDVPERGSAPSASNPEAIPGYDPAANRQRVSIRSLPRKGKPFADPPDLSDEAVYQDEWIYHLTRKFGKAEAGGVRYYAMDNEPDLWASTHIDMHPVRPDYAEMLRQFLDYATAVKDVDPSAQITGPVSWGWTSYFFSARDQGADNYATHADRRAHDNQPFLPWFLEQVAAHDRKAGRRTLDVLDVHYYPQGTGVYGGRADAAANALRLRSVRSLWDPEYVDESWIRERVQLVPRLREWVSRHYPGTKIGLTEWNWGADKTLNGGLAVAEVLGVLGRERVDMACYWTSPGIGTPGFFAYKMFRNADDAGNGFGDRAVVADSTDYDRVSCYGSVDSRTRLPIILVINKMPDKEAAVTLAMTSHPQVQSAQVFRYSNANLKSIARLPDTSIENGKAALRLPAYSLTLLRCQ